MKPCDSLKFPNKMHWTVMALICAVALLVPAYSVGYAQQAPAPVATTSTEEAPLTPPDQLDSLVAPFALYPDPILAQVLAASTYPLEIIQLEQWMKNNPNLK